MLRWIRTVIIFQSEIWLLSFIILLSCQLNWSYGKQTFLYFIFICNLTKWKTSIQLSPLDYKHVSKNKRFNCFTFFKGNKTKQETAETYQNVYFNKENKLHINCINWLFKCNFDRGFEKHLYFWYTPWHIPQTMFLLFLFFFYFE